MIQTRDVRLTYDQLAEAVDAVHRRRRDLERRLKRTSYEGKPGMKSAVVKSIATLRTLEGELAHNQEQLRRQQAKTITDRLGPT